MRALASFLVLLIAGIAAAFAADDPLMKQAQSTFEPIPLKPPAIKDVTATPAMIELGKAPVLRSPFVAEPQHQLQHMPSDRAWRRGHAANVHRP